MLILLDDKLSLDLLRPVVISDSPFGSLLQYCIRSAIQRFTNSEKGMIRISKSSIKGRSIAATIKSEKFCTSAPHVNH